MRQGYVGAPRVWLGAFVSTAIALAGASTVQAQVIPASAEHVTQISDIVVLGKITASDPEGIEIGPMRQLYTRHTMKVETYYKGSGPTEISILTAGGIWTSKEGDKEVKHLTQAVGSVGVRVGEEILAFLRTEPEGFSFVEWDGAKYPVETDPDSGARSVQLRLSKKCYMHGAALEGFKKLEDMEKGENPAAAVEAKLSRSNFLTERIPVKDLRPRIEEIDAGEKAKHTR